jgi:RNA polymerase sigma-70 factor, ECF subfamily
MFNFQVLLSSFKFFHFFHSSAFFPNLVALFNSGALDQSDKKLLEEIKRDSEAAFDALFRKYYRNLVYFALKTLKNMDAANEVVQDLFVVFWEKRQQLEPQVSLKAYLFRATFNNCIHYINKQKKIEGDDLGHVHEGFGDFSDLMEASELETRIFGLIEQLPNECKRIFKMSRFDELKYQQIAERLNISVKTVETQISRALKFLRANLGDYVHVLWLIISRFFYSV